MSHLHFGRAVPITFRRFPPLFCRNLLGEKLKIPRDLAGRQNVLVVGFKTAHYADVGSWMPFANKLRREMSENMQLDEPAVQVYRLIIRQPMGILLRWWTDERLRLAVGDGSTEGSEEFFREQIIHPEEEKENLIPSEEVDGPVTGKVPESHSHFFDSGAARTPEAVRAGRLQRIRSHTLVSFTSKSAFVEALQIADAQRAYIFLVNREGEIAWCEHESYSPAKEANLRQLLELPASETLLLSEQQSLREKRLLM
ncbi:hypothetical protein Efla_007557 [Eimeria flavescens]